MSPEQHIVALTMPFDPIKRVSNAFTRYELHLYNERGYIFRTEQIVAASDSGACIMAMAIVCKYSNCSGWRMWDDYREVKPNP